MTPCLISPEPEPETFRPLQSKPQVNDRPGDPLEYISASRLKSYLSCPLKFYFEKVRGIQKPGSIKAHLGKAVHAALQHWNRTRWMGAPAARDEVVLSFLAAFHDSGEKEWVSGESKDVWDKQTAIGTKVIEAYLASGIHAADEAPIGVEVRLQESIEGIPVPLLGIVDLVQRGNRIVDYKTTATRPNESTESWLHEIQLVMYAHLIQSATGEPVKELELVYLVKTKEPKVIPVKMSAPSKEQHQRFRSLVDVYLEGVSNQRYYPCPGMHCAWCPFQQECQQWTGQKVSLK